MTIIEDWTEKVTTKDLEGLARVLPLPYEIIVDPKARRVFIVRVCTCGSIHKLEVN